MPSSPKSISCRDYGNYTRSSRFRFLENSGWLGQCPVCQVLAVNVASSLIYGHSVYPVYLTVGTLVPTSPLLLGQFAKGNMKE